MNALLTTLLACLIQDPQGPVAVPLPDDPSVKLDVIALKNGDELVGSLKPRSWSDLEVGLVRKIVSGERHNEVLIQMRSPVTGELVGLRFRGFGSTLRGARIAQGVEADPTFTRTP